jgi:hypothetical protein
MRNIHRQVFAVRDYARKFLGCKGTKKLLEKKIIRSFFKKTLLIVFRV